MVNPRVTPIADDELIWERTREETEKAWLAFVAYRDLPQAERTIRAAFNRMHPNPSGPQNAPDGWYKWGRRYQWLERAAAMDAYRARLELAAEAEEKIKARRMRRGVLAQSLRRLSEALQTMDLSKASAADVARLLDISVRQLREEYDETPAQKVALGGLQGAEGQELPIVISYAQSRV